MQVNVTVFFVASKNIIVDVPNGLDKDAVRDYVQDELNKDLPEVHEGSRFEFPCSFQMEGDDFETDLKG